MAGELIFALPFHIARYFKPSLMSALNINNTALGDAFAIYGLLALLCYLPGGIIADKYSPKKLMVFSLLLTGLGGFYYSAIPSLTGLKFLFGIWGVTTILFFWGALIKYTSDWGGFKSQGRAFGYLEAGRGLTASLFSSLALIAYYLHTKDFLSPTFDDIKPIQTVIFYYAFLNISLGLILYFFLDENETEQPKKTITFQKGKISLIPILLISGVVVCAYCGFRALDNLGLYLSDTLNLDDIQTSFYVTLLGYFRILAAFAAGILADKIGSGRLIYYSFAFTSVTQLLASQLNSSVSFSVFFITGNLVIMYLAIVSLRAVYFSLIKSCGSPEIYTGTSVGIVSVIGFTPDIFFHPLMGRVLDSNPGVKGHQDFFFVTFIISLLGLVATMKLNSITRTKN